MNNDERALYMLVNTLGLDLKQISGIGLNPALAKISCLSQPRPSSQDEEQLIRVAPEVFSKAITALQKSDKKYEDNLYSKDDYSHYDCYMAPDGTAGFCIDQETRELCNFFSVAKGAGGKLLKYAQENYDIYGMANALSSTYEEYYQSKYDCITDHWEENWDYPGDKEKAVWYGYFLPKGTLSETERVEMIITGQKLKQQALSKEEVEERTIMDDKSDCCMLNPKQRSILSKALDKCLKIVKDNQIAASWREWAKEIPSKDLIASQMNQMFKKRNEGLI